MFDLFSVLVDLGELSVIDSLLAVPLASWFLAFLLPVKLEKGEEI